jgi:ketosteroid isomerase-like protein
MADDFQWTWMGTISWSKTFKRKEAVVGELLAAVKSRLAQPFRVVADRFIAEGEYVVVESRGQNAIPDGRTYNNKYCWVCRIAEGTCESYASTWTRNWSRPHSIQTATTRICDHEESGKSRLRQ